MASQAIAYVALAGSRTNSCRPPRLWVPVVMVLVAWFPGQSALLTPPEDPATAAVTLNRFLHALHQPAPRDAPNNPWRGVPLAARAGTVQKHLQQLDGLVDRGAVLDLWGRVLATPPWSGPPLWIHGNLHPGNLLVSEGRLSAVIDFGDLTAGDPATDLSAFWMLLPSSERQTFSQRHAKNSIGSTPTR